MSRERVRDESRNQAHGSRTLTITLDSTENTPQHDTSDSPLTISLTGGAELPDLENNDQNDGPRVRWNSDVVDNEGLGRKKSKVCCIFKKQKEFGESSSEDDTSSDEEQTYHGNSIGGPNSYEKMPRSSRRKLSSGPKQNCKHHH